MENKVIVSMPGELYGKPSARSAEAFAKRHGARLAVNRRFGRATLTFACRDKAAAIALTQDAVIAQQGYVHENFTVSGPVS